MGVSSYDITAAAFDPARAQDYELSILTGVDSFAYIVRERAINRLLAYRAHRFGAEEAGDWPAALERLVLSDDQLRLPRYGSVVLGWETDRMALVPRALFAADHRSSYLEQLTVVGLEDEVRSETFNELDAELVYCAPRDRIEAVERRLRVRRTHHYAGGLLTAWALRSRRIGHSSVSADVRGHWMTVAGHRKGNLLFHNTFHFDGVADALYYLLLAYRQSGFAADRVPLYLCGEITAGAELYRQFLRYVEDIRFCAYPVPPALPPELATLPAHTYFGLLCLG